MCLCTVLADIHNIVHACMFFLRRPALCCPKLWPPYQSGQSNPEDCGPRSSLACQVYIPCTRDHTCDGLGEIQIFFLCLCVCVRMRAKMNSEIVLFALFTSTSMHVAACIQPYASVRGICFPSCESDTVRVCTCAPRMQDQCERLLTKNAAEHPNADWKAQCTVVWETCPDVRLPIAPT
jgi:hypothetical protein